MRHIRFASLHALSFTLVFAAALCVHAQTTSPTPPARPTPTSGEPQEQVKIFTEEVQIPVFATDDYGRFDPTLQADDLLVLEDDVPQHVRSVRRVPSSVLLLLDTSGEMNPAMNIRTTRELAVRLIERLRTGDQVAALQFGGRVELIQNWTAETETAVRAIKTQLFSGRQSRLSEALTMAVSRLNEVPAGSRHVVLITDGVEEAGSEASLTEGVKQLLAAHAIVHVISYTGIGRRAMERSNPLVKVTAEKRKSAQDIADEIMNPTKSTDTKQKRKIYVIVDTDITMRRRRKEYEDAMKRAEQWLTSLAEETGGRLLLPQSTEEVLKQGDEVAREIGTQYVLTYTPKRPLASATKGEYRSVKVIPQRTGLRVRTRRGYVAAQI